MAAAHSTIPPWSAALPVAGLALYLLAGKQEAALAGLAFGVALLGCVVAAVHHAEVIAHRVGEPFGALILALSVTVIEVGLIVSIMLGSGEPQPTLARDTIHAVTVLVMHLLAGACILIGALRHRVQSFSTEGAQVFLTALIPMIVVVLVLPNFTATTPGPTYSNAQMFFVAAVCLLLWLAFVFTQTVRHRDYFIEAGGAGPGGARPSARVSLAAFALLVAALTAVVLLSKSVSPFLTAGVSAAGAPIAIVGVIIAAIVLMPEAATALRAAADNRLQTSINLCLGSGIASIGLTIPVVVLVAWWLGQPLVLGVGPADMLLLGLSCLMASITYGLGRTNLLSGVVHLILFATWVFLIFRP
jgi:Ca2+:H+ antiporter